MSDEAGPGPSAVSEGPTDGRSGDESAATGADGTVPPAVDAPTPAAVHGDESATGAVVWHREHLRTDDHRALAQATKQNDVVCPVFVFDPSFYGGDGLACDARLRFLHEAVSSLDRLYAAAPTRSVSRPTPNSDSEDQLAATTPLSPGEATGERPDGLLAGADEPGLTLAFGDPVEVLERFADEGWSVLTAATPTSRYGKRRDDRVRDSLGDAVEFVSGDGLVRDERWSRRNWRDHVETWFSTAQHSPAWDDTVHLAVETGVTPRAIEASHDVTPTKTRVPTGTHRAAATRLAAFVDHIEAYPGNISSPRDAREGTSGLSPYLTFGLLSVRQVYQYVTENAPDCRGREMFVSRLYWNRHYNQKLADWPGWTDRAVNPALEGFNEAHHDPELVAAWKRGETGFPMVDAAMRCLRETGWLNFRMRAMAASFFAHVLQQPWWIGADWYHHHLLDSDVGINYTQWQSQAGLVGKPSQRVYNPRKQVRDQDPEGEWITEWVPELEDLPRQFLDRPERTPLAVQADCGVEIGTDYPYPVVDFDARREQFWSRYERVRPEAATALARPEVARRASLSGGYAAARSIAAEYGDATAADHEPPGRQASLEGAVGNDPDPDPDPDTRPSSPGRRADAERVPPGTVGESGHDPGESTLPTGVGTQAGAPSPDDRAATPEYDDDRGSRTTADDGDGEGDDPDDSQTTIRTYD